MICVLNVPNSDSKILYNNADIAYQLANIITKSKTTAKALKDVQELTDVPWYENDDVQTLDEKQKPLYDEISTIRKFLNSLEANHFEKLKAISTYLTGTKKNYILLKTALPKNLQLNRKQGDWVVGFGKNAKATVTDCGITE